MDKGYHELLCIILFLKPTWVKMNQYLFSNTEFMIYVAAPIILYKGAIYVSFSNVNVHEEIISIKILFFP